MPTEHASRAIPAIPTHQIQTLLGEIASWGKLTTIIIHKGCVFEFKGSFPVGSMGEGYYNLAGAEAGFHGHLKLDAIDHVSFQTRPHRGRASYALLFNTADSECIFKIFLGRDDNGDILASQLIRFNQLLEQYS